MIADPNEGGPHGATLETNANGCAFTPIGRPLCQVADEAFRHVKECIEKGDWSFPLFATLTECVYLSNSQGVLVYSNESHRKHFSPNASPIGRTKRAFLDPVIADRADKIESLIFDGAPFVICENVGVGLNGATYHVVAHAASLESLNAPGLAILGVMKLTVRDDRKNVAKQTDLTVTYAKFRELNTRDQDICRQTALGVSSRELGESLDMTTRGVELRKQKIFAKLGVAKAVDLARLLTRLQDNGFIDMGL
jgi:DNA-binding CsgD family transcriptional regulator